VALVAGAGRIVSPLSSITSETESTTAPTTRPRTFSTITTVKWLYSAAIATQLQAQVDDGHDHATQVHHALEEGRGVGDAGGLLVGADLLHAQDVDAVFLGTEAEGQVLAVAGNGVGATRGFLLRDARPFLDHFHGVSPWCEAGGADRPFPVSIGSWSAN
jgi:hypothetical protein